MFANMRLFCQRFNPVILKFKMHDLRYRVNDDRTRKLQEP